MVQLNTSAGKRHEHPLLLSVAHFSGKNPVITESEFNELIEHTFEALEEALDQIDADIDYQMSGSVLTVEFDNDTKLVFSRQPPTRQLWLAARAGGFHFAYDKAAGDWRGTRDGQLFRLFVVDQMKIQGGITFVWR
jgi:CyaY protein